MIPAMYAGIIVLAIIMVFVVVLGVVIIPWMAVTGRFDKELGISDEMIDGYHSNKG